MVAWREAPVSRRNGHNGGCRREGAIERHIFGIIDMGAGMRQGRTVDVCSAVLQLGF